MIYCVMLAQTAKVNFNLLGYGSLVCGPNVWEKSRIVIMD